MKSLSPSIAIPLIAALAILSCPIKATAEIPYSMKWVKYLDSYNHSVATDFSGNVYVAGSVFLPEEERIGISDVFATKLDGNGNTIWTQVVGTTSADFSFSIAADGESNAYFAMESAPYGTRSPPDLRDYYYFKTGSDGNNLSSREIYPESTEASKAITVDTAGNIYVTGVTKNDLGGISAGEDDAFLTKLDSSGSELWVQQFGSTESDYASSVTTDDLGNIYVTGNTHGDIDGNGSADYVDVFVSKFDNDGNQAWTKQLHGTGYNQSYSIAVDAFGNSYIAGETTRGETGFLDAFLTKLDGNGNAIWTQKFGDIWDNVAQAVAVDNLGDIYVTGHTIPSYNETTVSPDWNNSNLFFSKYDSDGNELWTHEIDSGERDYGDSLAVDPTGNVYLTGRTSGHNGFIMKFVNPTVADYNADGFIDLGDYNEWTATYGMTVAPGLGADGNGDGIINAADYTIWRDLFATNPAATWSSSITVPEPSSILLTAFLFCNLCAYPLRRPLT